jgi:cell wall-associated NlpC family hydrolase
MTGDDFANAWIGTPFLWDGRGRDGVDCWGLVVAWHADVANVALPDWVRGARNRAAVVRLFAAGHVSHWHRLDAPSPGCIVLAPVVRPAHVGIYWRGGVLHAADGAGVVWHPLARFAIAHPAHQYGLYTGGRARA